MLKFFMYSLLSLYSGCLVADEYGFDSIFLLGYEKYNLNKIVDFPVFCNGEPGVYLGDIKAEDANKLFPFWFSDGRSIEVVFDGCNENSVVHGMSFSLNKDTCTNLKRLYSQRFGEPEVVSKYQVKWHIGNMLLYITNVTKDDCGFTIYKS